MGTKNPDPRLFSSWWQSPFSRRPETNLNHCYSSRTCTKLSSSKHKVNLAYLETWPCLTCYSENYQVFCFLEGSFHSDPCAISFRVLRWLRGWPREKLLNLEYLRTLITSRRGSCISIIPPSPFFTFAIQHRCTVCCTGLGPAQAT